MRNKLELKRDIIIDLEHEGENKSEELNKIKKELVMKENDVNELEQLLKEHVEKMYVLRDNNQSMTSQIGENIMMEKKINIQNKIINDLKNKLDQQESIKKYGDLDKLSKEIEELRKVNTAKEKDLNKLATKTKSL